MNTDSEKPPSMINGKRNPEYIKWWNSTEKAKAIRSKYRKSEKAKEVRRVSNQNTYPLGKRQCVECGITYPNETVIASNYKLVGRFHCICDLCR